jgi:hypothetical protein
MNSNMPAEQCSMLVAPLLLAELEDKERDGLFRNETSSPYYASLLISSAAEAHSSPLPMNARTNRIERPGPDSARAHSLKQKCWRVPWLTWRSAPITAKDWWGTREGDRQLN